jgi:hypothetical protein
MPGIDPMLFLTSLTPEEIVEVVLPPSGHFDMRLQPVTQRPREQGLGGASADLIVICRYPKAFDLGGPSQRSHPRRAESRHRWQIRNLLNRESGLDAFGDGKLLVDIVKWCEPDAAITKLPERELAGIGSGFARRAVSSSGLEKRKVGARIDQEGSGLQVALVGAGHALNERNHDGICIAVDPVSLPREETDRGRGRTYDAPTLQVGFD